MKALVPVLCVGTVFLFERLEVKLNEDEEFRKGALNNYPQSASKTA